MTALDFTQVRPDGFRTSVQDRLVAAIRYELIRSYSATHPDIHFHALAEDLTAEFSRMAATVDVNDYVLQIRRKSTTTEQLNQLADQN